jgi:hypothetical protein
MFRVAALVAAAMLLSAAGKMLSPGPAETTPAYSVAFRQ